MNELGPFPIHQTLQDWVTMCEDNALITPIFEHNFLPILWEICISYSLANKKTSLNSDGHVSKKIASYEPYQIKISTQ